MIIGPVDLSRKVMVVAEIGNNHEGSPRRAADLLRRAAQCGVDAVKFQFIRPEKLVQAHHTERLGQFRAFQLHEKDFEHLATLAQQEGVLFLCTPFDEESARFLNPLVPAFKIASGDNNHLPLLQTVAGLNKPVLLSTGLMGLEEIRHSKVFIEEQWRQKGFQQQLALLHCVCAYPVPLEEANLGAIVELQKKFGGVVGYSDHTLGIDAAVMAVALGARLIEKHFTDDHQFSHFRDHQLSAEPKEMKELVGKISAFQAMLGTGEKKPMPSEHANLTAARRSAVAARDLPQGTVLGPANMDWLRPGGGVPPHQAHTLTGQTLHHPLAAGELILPTHLAPPESQP